MAGSITQSDDGEIAGINVTPFVDIALVLLIIFMVTAKYIVSQSIPVDLPTASTSGATGATALAVSVDRTGQFYLDTTAVSDEQLAAALHERIGHDPDARAVITADRTVQHGRVMTLIDMVRAAGITHFAIQTELPTDAHR